MNNENWTRVSDDTLELIPADGNSRFVLYVRRTNTGRWQAFVSESEVEEGKSFASMKEAKSAAEGVYYGYWSDFEDPTDGL